MCEVEDILGTLLNPVSEFDFRFNLPKAPMEQAMATLMRASAAGDKIKVLLLLLLLYNIFIIIYLK